jgi:hypothetical protein
MASHEGFGPTDRKVRAPGLYMKSVNERVPCVMATGAKYCASTRHHVTLGLHDTQQCYTSWGHVTAQISRGSPILLSVWTHLITGDTVNRHMPPPTVTPWRYRRFLQLGKLDSIPCLRTGWGQRGSLWCAVAMLPSTGFNDLRSVITLSAPRVLWTPPKTFLWADHYRTVAQNFTPLHWMLNKRWGPQSPHPISRQTHTPLPCMAGYSRHDAPLTDILDRQQLRGGMRSN